jgi:hypothetical protein
MVECPVTNRPEITIAPYLLGSALHRLLVSVTIKALPHNLPPRYNICATDPVDVVIEHEGKRDFTPMRWGLVPSWWPKPLKKLRAATFNARAETVAENRSFRRRSGERAASSLHRDITMAGYCDRQAALVLHPCRRRADELRRPMGRMEGQGNTAALHRFRLPQYQGGNLQQISPIRNYMPRPCGTPPRYPCRPARRLVEATLPRTPGMRRLAWGSFLWFFEMRRFQVTVSWTSEIRHSSGEIFK